MKILGIDYGAKRVGIATADTDANMAFPRAVLHNKQDLIEEIKKICTLENIEKIVLGESKDLNGKDNAIAGEIAEFKKALEQSLGLPVFYEPEFYTSLQASRIQGDSAMIDASAAAIILQSHLDKYKAR
ncbi:MAG: Holliday junction resolvase RuvX [Patescibacteria group bacterium]